MIKAVMFLFNRKNRAMLRAVKEEAARRGMSVDQYMDSLTLEEQVALVERVTPSTDLTRWGLVPREQLVTEYTTGIPAIEAAVAAARSGDWQPAASLLASTFGDWDLRSRAVISLGEVAADDDRWLVAWRAARPSDGHAVVVNAEALVFRAWQLRGGMWAKDTSRTQFDGFFRVLPDAEVAARHAIAVMPDDPTPWATLATVLRGLQRGHDEFEPVWQGIVERAPLHRYGHSSALQYWCAKWVGSHERMFAFASAAVARSPALSVFGVQAAFECQDDSVWARPNVRHALDTLLQWLDTDGANSVNVRDDLGWAALALVESGRAAEALPLFRKLGTYAGGAPWSYWHSPGLTFDKYRVQACQASR